MPGIILSRPDRIGDVVISSSCFAAVKQAFPGTDLSLVAQARMAPLFHGHPALRAFVGIPAGGDASARREALAAEFRRLAADTIVHLHADPDVVWAAAAAGIPRRIGFRGPGDDGLTESLLNLKKTGTKHEGYYNFDLLKSLGVGAPAALRPQLAPDPAARDRLARKLPLGVAGQPYAVLHLGSHGDKPRLDPEFLFAAALWLVEAQQSQVILIGDERDEPVVREILAWLGVAAVNVHPFLGQSDLAETAFLLGDARLVFGRDSGPAHLAAAMGARTVTLMLEPEKENSARRWKPLGEHSWVLEKPLERRWYESRLRFARRNLAQFTTGEVIAGLRQALEA